VIFIDQSAEPGNPDYLTVGAFRVGPGSGV